MMRQIMKLEARNGACLLVGQAAELASPEIALTTTGKGFAAHRPAGDPAFDQRKAGIKRDARTT